MLQRLKTTCKLYKTVETENPQTFEKVHTQEYFKDISIAICERNYQPYTAQGFDIDKFDYVGFTDCPDVKKGMFINSLEVVHTLPRGNEFVIYLKKAE